MKPKEVYDRIEYKDTFNRAVLALESNSIPTEGAIDYIAKKCKVASDSLILMVAPTTSISGSIQISGRIVETGIHKLMQIGFDTKRIIYGCGYAPISPIHPKDQKAMGRTNDALYYGEKLTTQ